MVTGEVLSLAVYPGQTLTVTPSAGGSARAWFTGADGKPTADNVLVISSATIFGPYNTSKIVEVECILAPVTYEYGTFGTENVYPLLGNDILLISTAGVPTDGTSGTGAGTHGKGSLCIDRTNGKLYINGNTKASPTWKLVTSAT